MSLTIGEAEFDQMVREYAALRDEHQRLASQVPALMLENLKLTEDNERLRRRLWLLGFTE